MLRDETRPHFFPDNVRPIGVGVETPKAGISRACQDVGRAMHKFHYLRSGMTEGARYRFGRKQYEALQRAKQEINS